MTIKDYSSADITFKDHIAYTPEAEGRPAELFKGCLMLPETHMSKAQKDTLLKVTNQEIRAEIKCCWYLGSTLTEKEKPVLAAKNNEDRSAYLWTLMEQCISGERPCYELPPTLGAEENPEIPQAKLDEMKTKMTQRFGENGGLLLGITAAALPELEQTLATAMSCYPSHSVAGYRLAGRINETRALARDRNINEDVVALATVMMETGQVETMKAIMLEKAKGTDITSNTQLQHIQALNVSQRLALESLSKPTDLKKKESSTLRDELNLSNAQMKIEGTPELTLLPLAHETEGIWKGPNALPRYMLLTLQEYWKKEDKNVLIHKYVSGSKREWLDIAIMAVHKNIHQIKDMKNALWSEIVQNPEIKNQVPECQKYARNHEFSYIRLVYELRKRLSHDAGQLFMYEAYRKLSRRTGEKATKFVSRAASLREEAYCSQTDENYENIYTNPWDQHYEIVLKGFTNKQLMGEITRIKPKNMDSLKTAVEETESMFSLNIRLGLVQGQEDPRALVGLPLPSEEVIQQLQNKTGLCYNCGDRSHMRDQCPLPAPVCFRCKQPGHIRIDCVIQSYKPTRGNYRGRGARGAQRNQPPKKEATKIQQLFPTDYSGEAVWTPFSQLPGFPSGSQ